MVRKINSNKFGVIEYAIDTEEDLEKLPRKETDNTVYAILSKGGQNLIYLYSKELKSEQALMADSGKSRTNRDKNNKIKIKI